MSRVKMKRNGGLKDSKKEKKRMRRETKKEKNRDSKEIIRGIDNIGKRVENAKIKENNKINQSIRKNQNKNNKIKDNIEKKRKRMIEEKTKGKK